MANKKALLMVHFGTTHDDTRELTINKMNKKFSKKFTDYDFYEAYTSRIILKKLKDRDFLKDNPIKALEKIVANGYKELIVQSSHVILGIEYDNVVEEINLFKDQFESIKIGKPLLSTLEDYKKIAETLIKYYVPKEKNMLLYWFVMERILQWELLILCLNTYLMIWITKMFLLYLQKLILLWKIF